MAVVAAVLIMSGLPAPARSATLQVPDAQLAGVINRVEAAHRETKELQADFTQTTQYEGFPTPAISKGRLFIRRPGQMRWDYKEPSRHQIYVNGDEVIYLVPEHQQAIRSTMDREVQSPVPLMLLAGAASLSERFVISWDGGPGATNGRYRLRLTGKGVDTLLPLTIEADAKDFLIRRVTLHDPSGARTIFEFSGLKLNSGLDTALFTFAPPSGIEIVDAPPLLPQGAPAPRDEIAPR
jgi:outer membrane lipoprotein carrier protein